MYRKIRIYFFFENFPLSNNYLAVCVPAGKNTGYTLQFHTHTYITLSRTYAHKYKSSHKNTTCQNVSRILQPVGRQWSGKIRAHAGNRKLIFQRLKVIISINQISVDNLLVFCKVKQSRYRPGVAQRVPGS